MKRIDVVGKSHEELQKLLAKTPRQTLIWLIYRLATLEPHFTVEEFAALRRYTADIVKKWIRERKLTGVHVASERGDYRISLSGAHDFDRRTAIGASS